MIAVERIRGVARALGTTVKLGFGAAPARVSVAITAEVFAAAFGLAASYAIKFVVQEAAAGRPAGAILAAVALAVTGGGAAVSFLVYVSQLPKMIELITLKLDQELIALTNRIPTIEYHDRPAFADKLALVRQNRQSFATAIQMVGMGGRTALMGVGAIAIMASIDLRFLILPLFAVPRVFAGQKALQLTRKAQDDYAEPMRMRAHLYGKLASAPAGKEIRVFGLQQELRDRLWDISLNIRRLWDRSNWGSAGWLILGDSVFMAAYVAAIGWVVLRAARGEVGVGDVVLTATMAATLVGAITMAVALGQTLPRLMLTLERYHWLEDYARDEATKAVVAKTAPPPSLRRGIEVDAVSFTYPDRQGPALDDVSLSLPAGSVVALVGENGSGKSTLVKLLCGFYRPTAGRILVDGEDLAGVAIEAWRARVAAAFQDHANFEFLMHETVGVGELGKLGRKDLVSAAMDKAGGAALATLEPGGLDTLLGRQWGGTELSGGQWQKLALARSLFRPNPLLIVLDEPSAAIDAAAEHEMFETFAAEARSGEAAGRVTLLISHRFSTVRMADAIAVLDKGRLKEFGSHKALMEKGGLYAELFELQARGYR